MGQDWAGQDWAGQDWERGHSLSVMVLVVTTALFLVVGLVVDGGQRVTATRQAMAVADQAARAATDAAAAARLEDGSGVAPAMSAARTVVATHPDVTGTVDLQPGGRVEVRTTSQADTLFLSVIGLGRVTGHGSATADLLRSE